MAISRKTLSQLISLEKQQLKECRLKLKSIALLIEEQEALFLEKKRERLETYGKSHLFLGITTEGFFKKNREQSKAIKATLEAHTQEKEELLEKMQDHFKQLKIYEQLIKKEKEKANTLSEKEFLY